jgi:succinoglycan biosynthesis protein ExoM
MVSKHDQDALLTRERNVDEQSAVAICIATFRRPEGLRRTLLSINRLDFREPSTQVEIIVVDNDSRRSAEGVAREVEGAMSWPLVYVVEPRQGISHARNAAIRATQAEFIAFVDDDEEATTNWLRELLLFQRATGAAIVTGPVVPLFEEEPPAWVRRGGFFERPRRLTGTVVQHAGTGNLLLRRSLLSSLGARPFEETMALTGGTDTLLSMKLSRVGHSILWCDEAVIEEWNPPSRTTPSWLLRRAFRGGTTYARCESIVYRSDSLRMVRILKGLGRAIQGSGRILLGTLTLRFDRIIAGAQTTALGVGMVMGAIGLRYEEYRRAAR